MKILRWVLVSFVLLLLPFLAASQKIQMPKMPEPEAEEKEEMYGYDLSQYITLGDITAVKANFEDPITVTDQELDAAIFQILLSFADFTEKSEPAQRYNKVTVDYVIEQNGQVLEDQGQTDYEIVIGLKTEDPIKMVLGEEMIGRVVGEEVKAEYTFPTEIVKTSLSGQQVLIKAVVKKVEKQLIPELIDAWVQETFGGKFDSVQAFRDSVREDVFRAKEMEKASAVWLALLDEVRVRSYPEKEIASYALVYEEYYRTMAENFDVKFEDFVTVYMEETMEEFKAEARLFAEEKVKNDMIFTQLVRLQGVELSEEEYAAGVQTYFNNEEGDFNSLEEFISFYGEEELRRSILWDKALQQVVSNAVRINP